jgi:GGDEF domain-containing protein
VDTLIGRIRTAARTWNESSGKPWRIRFSIGGAEFDTATCESLEELINRADAAMYEDKRGRGRETGELDDAGRPG